MPEVTFDDWIGCIYNPMEAKQSLYAMYVTWCGNNGYTPEEYKED